MGPRRQVTDRRGLQLLISHASEALHTSILEVVSLGVEEEFTLAPLEGEDLPGGQVNRTDGAQLVI